MKMFSVRTGTFLAVLFLISIVRSRAADDYVLGPDSKKQDGVPQGEVSKYTFENSKIFPGSWREYWIYIPRQYDPAKPANLFVCQDGIQYQAPVVFDNLIAKGEMPVTIGLFIMHGRVRALSTNALDRFNRSYEYDGLGDKYARFVMEELIPEVLQKRAADGRPIKISTNPNDHCIAGASSGAICAFTAAWERPDFFRRVFSSIGTYVDQQGGNVYPALIRKTEAKPLRIFLQDGSNDQNIYGGNWFLANQEMLSALEYAGYEVTHAWRDGGHNGKQAGAIFPDAMRWIWKDWPKAVEADPEHKSRQPINQVISKDADWIMVGEGYKFTEGPAANSKGEIFFTDIPNNRIHKIGSDGKVSVFAENSGGSNGLKFGPDGKLYACANNKKQIVSYDEAGQPTTVAEGFQSNDLAISHKGDIYVTDPENKKVWFIRKGSEPKVVDTGLGFANGICFSPDQSLLYVADTKAQYVHSYQIQEDGTLSYKQRYFHLELVDASMQSGADGIAVDTLGSLYVTTEMGVQFCDQAGRVQGIIRKPQRAWLSNVAFGGPEFDELYATCGDKIYKRKVQTKGALAFNSPVKPKAPGL